MSAICSGPMDNDFTRMNEFRLVPVMVIAVPGSPVTGLTATDGLVTVCLAVGSTEEPDMTALTTFSVEGMVTFSGT